MHEMMEAYDTGAKRELDKYIKKMSGGKDSISRNYNWYKLDDLKQYIGNIERISKEKDIEVTGFRICTTSCPIKHKIEDLQRRQTLIFTPTTKIGNKEGVAFEPMYFKNGKPIDITKFLEQVRVKKSETATLLPFSLEMQTGLESLSANRILTNPTY